MMTTLQLTVISAPAGSPLNGQQLDVSVAGSTLGRGTTNAVVLADPERIVSTRHASIRHDLGQFVMTDHSTNGTFLNDSPMPLGPEKSVPLQDGDVIAMGKYRFKVSLKQAAASPAPSAGFLDDLAPPAAATPAPVDAAGALDDFDKWLEPQATPAAQQQPLWGISNVEHVSGGFEDISDPLAAIDKAQQNDQDFFASPASVDDDQDWWKGSQQDNAPALNQAFNTPQPHTPEPPPFTPPSAPVTPPDILAEPLVDDADSLDALLGLDSSPAPAQPFEAEPPAAHWPDADITDGLNSSWAEPAPVTPVAAPAPYPVTDPVADPAPAPIPVAVPTAAPSPTPAPTPMAGDAGTLLAQLLELGALSPEQLQQLPGEVTGVLREAVARMVDMLRARSSIKNELRLERTMIQPLENNPLKFALTEKDALRYLFGERSGAYLSGRRAVQEAFGDIEQHQLALLAGVRSAYEKMLQRFAPEALEKQFADSVQVGLLGNKKSRLWDAYSEYFDKLRQDPEVSFNTLFGNEFAEAYEDQINTLKSSQRNPSRSRKPLD